MLNSNCANYVTGHHGQLCLIFKFTLCIILTEDDKYMDTCILHILHNNYYALKVLDEYFCLILDLSRALLMNTL